MDEIRNNQPQIGYSHLFSLSLVDKKAEKALYKPARRMILIHVHQTTIIN